MHRILLISDGHGEDWVAAQIARHLRQRTAECGPLELLALPMVGEGHIYEQVGLPVALDTRVLPSGGFTFKSPAHLWLDLRGGLAAYSRHLLRTTQLLSGWADLVVAVGDILPLGLAWLTGRPYVFVGCTKSDYYTDGRHSCYFLPERRLMQPPRCLHTFTRDAITCRNLRRAGVPASYWGNPMMDGLEVGEAPAAGEIFVGLLPGSRPEEAQRNLVDMLPSLQAIHSQRHQPVHFEAAVSAGLGLASFHRLAATHGWQSLSDHCLGRDGTLVHLRTGNFGSVLSRSHLLVAMAGTATEQAVGLGKPVVTFPGRGPQFTRRFAHLQRQLLGESVLVIDRPAAERPRAVADAVWTLLADGERLNAIRRNGRERMGTPGGARRIADFVVDQLPIRERNAPQPRG